MMDKVTLGSIATFQSDTSAVAQYNANNAALIVALDNTLSRDGTSPNQMNSTLDMNSNRIVNLPPPLSTQEPLRVIDATTLKGGGIITVSPLPAGGTTGQVLNKTSNADYVVGWTAVPALSVPNTWSATQTFAAPTNLTNTLNINPSVGSSTQGLNITQTGAAGSVSGPLLYNSIFVTNPTVVTSPFTLTNGMGNFETRAFHVELNDTSGSTIASAISGHLVCNTGSPSGDKIAGLFNAYTNKNINGFILGVDSVASVDTGSTTNTLCSAQLETAIYGGVVTNRMGLEVTNDTSIQATTFDAAIAIDNVGTVAGAFKKGLSFGSSSSLAVSIDAAGDLFYVKDVMTVANVCNFSNLTVTGNIFNLPNFSVTNTNNQNAPAVLTLTNSGAGTSVQSQVLLSNGTNTLSLSMAGVNSSTLGVLYQGRGYLTANGSGLVLGTSTPNPCVFAINNNQVGQFDNAVPGQLNLGVSGAVVGKLQFNNATSGSITFTPQTGALGSSVLTLPAVTGTVLTTGAASGLITTITNSLGSDVVLNSVTTYFDGPSVAQGTSGTWFVSGVVTLVDTGSAGTYNVKLWDGTTVIASCQSGTVGAAGSISTATLSGFITSPAGNLRISVKDISAITGKILFNQSGNSKDSTITAIRIA